MPKTQSASSSSVVSSSRLTPPNPLARITDHAKTKLLLVDFRSGEALDQHPDVAPFLQDGWQVGSAVPRIVESQGPKLLVVLKRPGRAFR